MSSEATDRDGARTTVIEPLPEPLHGTSAVPGDKSISHRAVIFSAMAEGSSPLTGVLDSQDVRSSLAAVAALGAKVDVGEQPDGSLSGTITGWGAAGPHEPDEPVDCGNSGTTARLLMGVLAPWDVSVTLTGDDSLRRRPMRRITVPLQEMGATFEPADRDTLPLTERGTRTIRAVTYDSPVASAQLKTAVLLAGIFADGTTAVHEPAASRNHTELMLPSYGVPVEARDGMASVTGPAALRACEGIVPGDPSSAAFIACAALLKEGSDVTITRVSLNSGRIGFARVLARMGASIEMRITDALEDEGGKPSPDGRWPFEVRDQQGEICGSLHVAYTPGLVACEVEASEIASLIDEVPVLALVAAHARGTTVFHEVGELRVKETDRLAAIVDGLALIGVHAYAQGDDLIIEGDPNCKVPAGTAFDSLGDHRLAMTWALVGLCGTVPVKVRDFEAVAVSYPAFLDDMRRLGA